MSRSSVTVARPFRFDRLLLCRMPMALRLSSRSLLNIRLPGRPSHRFMRLRNLDCYLCPTSATVSTASATAHTTPTLSILSAANVSPFIARNVVVVKLHWVFARCTRRASTPRGFERLFANSTLVRSKFDPYKQLGRVRVRFFLSSVICLCLNRGRHFLLQVLYVSNWRVAKVIFRPFELSS